MYYPYFRGKQYELITIRECAGVFKKAGFVPIIEPVKEDLGGVIRSLEAVISEQGESILIANPSYGDLSQDSSSIFKILSEELSVYDNIIPGILLTEDVTLEMVNDFCDSLPKGPITFLHSGFSQGKELSRMIDEKVTSAVAVRHVFFEDKCGKLYQRHFKRKNNVRRVLLRDGFQKRTNREHPGVEFFSDLHATFEEENMDGFGDFLIVGDGYLETGGPAYAVAIHLTFIDNTKDGGMYVYHFKSDRQNDPKDPAGKFREALNKLVFMYTQERTLIQATSAIEEFVSLHEEGHFPGLGYVKKLSMKHHVETLASYLSYLDR